MDLAPRSWNARSDAKLGWVGPVRRFAGDIAVPSVQRITPESDPSACRGGRLARRRVGEAATNPVPADAER
jgi:hypothetical protein